MPTPSFNCGQQELYAISRLGWNSCTEHLADFTAFKGKYVAAFITARLAEIDAAELLPDQEQREEDSRTLRVNLKNKATEGLNLWQRLKRYITEAFPEDQLEIKLDAAGQAHYRNASRDEWASMQRVMLDGNTFITDNTAALSAGGNMPVAFAATFTTAKTEFDDLYQQFLDAAQNNEVETQTKIIANNDVHAKLMSMFLDGQEIYKTNEAVKKLFTFDQVLLTVSGPGISGIKGLIKDSATNFPIQTTATVTIFGTAYTTTSDEDGRYELPAAADTYASVLFTCPGYNDHQETNVLVQPGTMKTLNVTLTPAP